MIIKKINNDMRDMNLTVYSVNEEFAVSEAFLMFRTMGLRHLLVVGASNKLRGMITKKDLVEHNCIEKYKELKRYSRERKQIIPRCLIYENRLKKMNIDLPMGQELDTVPGTPAEPADPSSAPPPTSLRAALRKHLSQSSLLNSSQAFISRNLISRPNASAAASPRVEYGIDPDISIV